MPFVGQTEGKGRFQNVIFCIQISQICFSQKVSQQSVYAGCVILMCEPSLALYIIIRTVRGQAELLILREGNARACMWDKRQKVYSRALFVSTT